MRESRFMAFHETNNPALKRLYKNVNILPERGVICVKTLSNLKIVLASVVGE